jgi:hypothetical protein
VQANKDGTYDGVVILTNTRVSRLPGHMLKK